LWPSYGFFLRVFYNVKMVNKKKNILFVITHLELGGAQKQLLYILRNLDREKYRLFLYAGNRGYLKEKFSNIPGVTIRLDFSLVRHINPLLDFITFFKIFHFVKKYKIDIVHTHSPKASALGRWAAFFAGVKNIIYTVHGWPFHDYMNPLVYNFYLFLEKTTAVITKRIVVVSRADFRRALKRNIAIQEKISLIHYGVDIRELEKVYQARNPGQPPRTVFTISSLKPQKGLIYFLNAAKLLLENNHELNFIIVGDGPLRKRVEKQIRFMGLEDKVQLKGWLDEAFYFFKEPYLFVLSSLWEGLPVALIEAVLSGAPAVVTDTGGVLDIVDNFKNGIVVNPKRVEELSEAVKTILDNYNEWQRMIDMHREELNLSYWSQERMIKQLNGIYAAS